MKEVGLVIEKRGNKALVEVTRRSACSKCNSDCSLAGNSHEIDETRLEVDNPPGAVKGQKVRMEMGEKPLVTAAILIYIFPLIALISGYFAGNWFAVHQGLDMGEVPGIVGSILFLILSFILVRLVDGMLGKRKEFQPVITEIING